MVQRLVGSLRSVWRRRRTAQPGHGTRENRCLGPVRGIGSTMECLPAACFRHGGLYHMWYNAVGVPTVFSTGTIGYATVRGRVESWIQNRRYSSRGRRIGTASSSMDPG